MSKWKAMRGEVLTAINSHRNIGNIIGISSYKGERICVCCGEYATSIEHMIPKGNKGGNLTNYNAMPVCDKHTKKGNTYWRDFYSKEDQEKIFERMGFDESNCMNPFIEENKILADNIRPLVGKFFNNIAKDFGIDDYMPKLKED